MQPEISEVVDSGMSGIESSSEADRPETIENANDDDNIRATETLINDEKDISSIEDGFKSEEVVKDVDRQGNEPKSENADYSTTSLLVPSSSGSAIPSVTVQLLVPSLRGKLISEGAVNTCRGVWAMSDAAHETPGQTSDFEFKLVTASDPSKGYPYSGKYLGWFMLKNPPPAKTSQKVEDKDMYITFTAVEGEASYKIEGRGINKFGKFNLRGTLSPEGMLQMYREYQLKANSPRKRSTSTAELDQQGGDGGAATTNGGQLPNKLKKVKSLSVDVNAMVPADASKTPREGSARARKPSAVLKEAAEAAVPTPRVGPTPRANSAQTPKASQAQTPRNGAASTSSAAAPSSGAAAAAASGIERAKRPPVPMQKCGDILKELYKLPQSVWFQEPVDYVKLNIPDYPTIIKQPMDLKTVRTNLEGGVYQTPEAFADHVRLVFRNAVNYNQLRDNPVHIAARELSTRFEDRFRVLMTHYMSGLGAPASAVPEPKVGRPSIGGGSGAKGKASSSGKGAATGKTSIAPGQGAKGRPSVGPRPVEVFLPPVVDASMQTMLEMQRRMEEMSNELKTLRTQVFQSEVRQNLEVQRDAAQNPLTFEEKKTLIAKIHKLAPNKMEEVVEIIQAAMPPESRADGEEIEIPLDELDTYTLRRLQKFVEESEHGANLQRLSSSSSLKSQGSGASNKRQRGGAEPAAAATTTKKALGRPPSATKLPPPAATPALPPKVPITAASSLGEDDEQDDFPTGGHGTPAAADMIDPDDLFFSNESFDDLRAHAAASGAGDASDASDDEDDDEPPVKKPFSGQTRALANADAWTTSKATAAAPAAAPSSTSSAAKSSGGDPSAAATSTADGGLWSVAADEAQEKTAREHKLKQEEERLADLRIKQDADRIAALQQQARQQTEERENKEKEDQRRREEETKELQQRREDERKEREKMNRTVELDGQVDALAYLDSEP